MNKYNRLYLFAIQLNSNNQLKVKGIHATVVLYIKIYPPLKHCVCRTY